MTGTDTLADGNFGHDHTYYGFGCTNPWTSEGEISTKSCSVRLVATRNNVEIQDIGVYYNFSAAASGSGSQLTTDNANIPDTFCPLGWQLPYSGTGGDYYDKSKSWKFLFAKYSMVNDTPSAQKTNAYPFDYIYSGFYYYDNGALFAVTSGAHLWSITKKADYSAYRFDTWGSGLQVNNYYGNYGDPLRCAFDISNLESSPWHPRSLISIMAFHFLKAHFPSVKIMSNYLKNETKYFIFMELRANFDEAESKYKMENRILMSELQDASEFTKDAKTTVGFSLAEMPELYQLHHQSMRQ